MDFDVVVETAIDGGWYAWDATRSAPRPDMIRICTGRDAADVAFSHGMCHVYGPRPLRTDGTDRAATFWPLALLSFGQSWPNSHHADPACCADTAYCPAISTSAPGDLDAGAAPLSARSITYAGAGGNASPPAPAMNPLGRADPHRLVHAAGDHPALLSGVSAGRTPR
jgi:hypothetical protein